MPTSAPYAIPIIANVARQVRPRSVLEIGVGFGKYGVLLREYLDIWEMNSLADYDRTRWRTRIEGIEATREYITPLHDFIYDTIHIGDATRIIDTLDRYDLILMADVLEHFDKPTGAAFVRKLYDHADRCVLLTYPEPCEARGNVLGNPYEAHHSDWNKGDFKPFSRVAYKHVEGKAAVVAIVRPPHPLPLLTPCFGARRREGWKGLAAAGMVRVLGPVNASRLATWLRGRPRTLRT